MESSKLETWKRDDVRKSSAAAANASDIHENGIWNIGRDGSRFGESGIKNLTVQILVLRRFNTFWCRRNHTNAQHELNYQR